MRKRTHSREIALQALYQLEVRGDEIAHELESFCRQQANDIEVSGFSIELVNGCVKFMKDIDKMIIAISEKWDLHRMPIIDRNVLRLACYELFYENDIPPKVSINEAIDLAKKFSTEKSGLFVNGVLDKIYSHYSKSKDKLRKSNIEFIKKDDMEFTTRKNADLHIHTKYSDGTMTPEQIVEEALKLNLRTIAITDHDGIDAVAIAQSACEGKDIDIIPALELSSHYNFADIHILGYYVDTKNISLLEKLSELHLERVERIKKITSKLKDLGVEITAQEVYDVAGEGAPGRLHVAEALCIKGICYDIWESFQMYLSDDGPAYVPKTTLTLEEAIKLIISAGGIPVLAHPGVTKKDELIPKMVEYGLQGIEAYSPSHLPRIIEKYTRLAKKYDLVVTGGSDFHGERKPGVKMGCMTIDDSLVEKIKDKHNEMAIC